MLAQARRRRRWKRSRRTVASRVSMSLACVRVLCVLCREGS